MMPQTQLASMFIGQTDRVDIREQRKQTPAVIHVLDGQTDEIIAVIGKTQPFWDDNYRRQLENNAETFEFHTPANGPENKHLKTGNRLIIPDSDGFFREMIIYETVHTLDTLEVYSRSSFHELKKAKPIPPETYTGATINTMLDTVLNGTGWHRGITDFSGSHTIQWERYYMPFESLQLLKSPFEVEFGPRIEQDGPYIYRFVDAVKKIGADDGKESALGKDVLNVERRDLIDNQVTALLGLGPEKEDGTRLVVEVTDEAALQAWGRGKHKWQVYEPESNNVDMTIEQLEQYTRIELDKRKAAAISYKIKAVDTEQVFGRSHEKVRLGDTQKFKIKDLEPPIYVTARVVAVEGPISDRSQKEFTLGEYVEYSESEIEKLRQSLLGKIANKSRIVESDTPPDDTGVTWINTNDDSINRYNNFSGQWESRADKTSTRTSADVQTGEGKAVKERGADVTGNNTASDVQTGENKAVRERGADVTGNHTSKDTAEVAGEASSMVRDRAKAGAEARNIFNEDGTLNTTNLLGAINLLQNQITASGNYRDALELEGKGFKLENHDAESEHYGALYIGPGYIMLANSKKEDGSWNWGVLGNGSGLSAEYMVAGTMLFDRLMGGQLTIGGINNGNGVFVVKDEEGEVIMELNASNGGVQELRIGDVISTSVVKTNFDDYTIEIDPANGDLWQDAINSIPKYNEGNVTIKIIGTNGSTSENVVIEGFVGSGTITIDIQTPRPQIDGTYTETRNQNRIYASGFDVNGTDTPCVLTNAVPGSQLDDVTVYGNGHSVAFENQNGATVYSNLQAYDVDRCIRSSYASQLTLINCKGLGNVTGIEAIFGGLITGYGTAPDSNSYPTSERDGGQILSSFTPDAGSATPPAPPEITKRFKAVDAGAWRPNFGGQWAKDQPLQGEWDGYGPYKGAWIFDGLGAELTGTSIKRMRMYAERRVKGGNGQAEYIRFRYHNYTSIPSGEPTLSDDVKAALFKWGEDGWVELPPSFFAAFENGNAEGIGIYSGSGAYAYMLEGAIIEVTYQ